MLEYQRDMIALQRAFVINLFFVQYRGFSCARGKVLIVGFKPIACVIEQRLYH